MAPSDEHSGKLLNWYFVKGIQNEAGAPKRSANWVFAKRWLLKCYENRVVCGSWIIPYSQVSKATLYKFNSLIGGGYVFELITKDATYQFGMNPWANLSKSLNIPLDHQQVKLGYSPFSIALRVVVVLLIGKEVYQWLAQ